MGGRVHTDARGNVTGFSWPFSAWATWTLGGCCIRFLFMLLWFLWPLAFLGHGLLGWTVEVAWSFLIGVLVVAVGLGRPAAPPVDTPPDPPAAPAGPRDWSPRQP